MTEPETDGGPTALINSRKISVREGESILSAARRLSIAIPTLCHDD